MAFRTGLQLARVPVLLALLAAAVPVMGRLIEARARLAAEEAEQVGALLTALAIAFVVVALVGRGRRHPRWLLAIEGVVAALIGLGLPAWELSSSLAGSSSPPSKPSI